jgi:tRNA dimethylallyltransferase
MPPQIPLLVIAGPTATGKTEAALEVAAACPAEIISADSMQIYRDLDLGTAKPSLRQREQAVFHLVDFVPPEQTYTVADFQRDARAAVEQIWQRGRLPVVCGGTGLYIRALLRGLHFPPGALPETSAARQHLEQQATEPGGAERLHQRLQVVDPTTAARLPVGDVRRVIRALEVYEATGRPFSQLARVDDEAVINYNASTFVLVCPRERLYERIERRVDEMMADGWLGEVETLRQRGLGRQHQCLQAIGYRHLWEYLETGGELAAVVADIKQATRRFAKRQLTWFRREPAQWLEWSGLDQWQQAVAVLTSKAFDVFR